MSALDLDEQTLIEDSSPRQIAEPLILLIDSDPSSVEFMARALTQSAMHVVIADRISGAGSAAAQLQSHPNIGVVVLDPETVPGRDNLTELRESGLGEDVQIILVAEPVMLGRYAQAARGEIADLSSQASCPSNLAACRARSAKKAFFAAGAC